jgi:AcrR family transcriptional regulator
MPTSPPLVIPRSQPRREHLIEVAHALFNQHGFHQTGIDLIMRESGVSKTTLYKYFPAKEDLVLEVLKLRSARILGGMEERLRALLAAQPDATSDERIGEILDVIEAWIKGTAFFGCNFVRAAAEYSDPGHPIGEQAKEHKQALLALIADQLEGRGEDARDNLASEILLIIEGAISVAQVGYETAPVAVARRLIALVLKG